LLQDPSRLAQEYQRRLQEPDRQENRAMLEAQATKLKQGLSRLIDSYADGLIDKEEFPPRVERSKEKLRKLEQAMQALTDQEARQQELRRMVRYLEEFAQRVTAGLEQADWTSRRELIRTLVQRVEIGAEAVPVVFRVEPGPLSAGPQSETLPHCRRRKRGFCCEVKKRGLAIVRRDPGTPEGSVKIEFHTIASIMNCPLCQSAQTKVLSKGQILGMPFENRQDFFTAVLHRSAQVRASSGGHDQVPPGTDPGRDGIRDRVSASLDDEPHGTTSSSM
jgi:hypothetical protein